MKERSKRSAISIIVPVYKAEKYLPDCLDSILGQSFTDFELILVNDGSPDNSGAICDEYAAKDNRVRVIHKTNGGASTARYAGVKAATGKYIGWVDADDRIAPSMFSTLFFLAGKYNSDIAECQYITVKGNEQIRSGIKEPIIFGTGDFILKQFFNAQMKPSFVNKLYRSELFANIEFPARQIHVDCYINMRFALLPLTYVRTSEANYYYIIRENSNITTYTARQIREAIYLFDYTMNLTMTGACSNLAKKYLIKDAINRLMGRYFEVSVNARITKQNVYNHYLRKKLGLALPKYLLLSNLPLKTKISYLLLLLNLKGLQKFLHKYLGKKAESK